MDIKFPAITNLRFEVEYMNYNKRPEILFTKNKSNSLKLRKYLNIQHRSKSKRAVRKGFLNWTKTISELPFVFKIWTTITAFETNN